MFVVTGALAILLTSAAGAEANWDLVQSSPLKIRVREKDKTGLQEVWAEGQINADVRDVEETLMSGDAFVHFMPYVKESREIGKADADGGVFIYTRVELPWVQSRDFVTKTFLVESAGEDGSGVFRNKWISAPEKIPKRHGVVRMPVNEGTWEVKSLGAGKSWAKFRFSVDPGGWIPGFAKNFGSTQGVGGTFEAVEAEALRRAAKRQKTERTGL